MSKIANVLLLIAGLWLIGAVSVVARTPLSDNPIRTHSTAATVLPAYCAANHDVGKLGLTVTNMGQIGSGFTAQALDCFTGEPLLSGEYPIGSNKQYLFGGALWIGAVVNGDTLVSVGADGWVRGTELHPDEAPFGYMTPRSSLDTVRTYSPEATSHQDFVAVYTDTYTAGIDGLEPDEVDGRPHVPLHVEVTQKSYAWDFPFAEDFVILEYSIKNIGSETLENMYVGQFVDGDVANRANWSGATDDFVGSLRDIPVQIGSCTTTVKRLAGWVADDDGDMYAMLPEDTVKDVTALALLSVPAVDSMVAFNWWVCNATTNYDYGPQTWDNLRYNYQGGLGTPAGDRMKYHILRNREIDYDAPFIATIDSTHPLWVPPTTTGPQTWEWQWDVRYSISTGPVSLSPGDSIIFAYSYVAGENLHVDANNYRDNFQLSYNPDAYMANLDFSDLQQNIVHALWMFDHPGVDTDSDGYFGQFTVCEGDTIFYEGDGVPDLAPGRKSPVHAFKRIFPPDNSHLEPIQLAFTWSSCPSVAPIESYDLTLKVGAVEVTIPDIEDTTVAVDLPAYVHVTEPVEIEWSVAARYQPWHFVPENGSGSFILDVNTAATEPDEPTLPTAFALEQNYPNPFNPSTEIAFALPRAEHVTVEIFNVTGQRVATVLDASLPAGEHVVTWNGRDTNGSAAASGVYFYRIEAGEFIATKKMMLLR